MKIVRYYRKINNSLILCFNFEITKDLSVRDKHIILSLIRPNIDFYNINYSKFIEFGPHLNIITPWCSNVLSILQKCNINNVNRIEKSVLVNEKKYNHRMIDKMTQTIYKSPLRKFNCGNKPIENFYFVDNIEKENNDQSLGFDNQDIVFYKEYFNELNRQPTNIELQDLSQSNSEHSRHWFFKGKLIKNNKVLTDSLFNMIKRTQNKSNNKSIIAFSDNASAIEGFHITTIVPDFKSKKFHHIDRLYHLTFTAETHNFPTGISPFQGATTGTGGRIRDGQSIGRGGLIIAGTAGYCVGEIRKGFSEYWKKNLETLIKASDGASDYGNKFGEPIILGFCRTYGNSKIIRDYKVNKYSFDHIEWIKPIMFSGGIGQLDNEFINKHEPNSDMIIVKIGGPAYRIGMGGGSASSQNQDTKNKNKDLNAVQRGDPEMENRLNRVIRTCIELRENNPILSIHDQGAGGTGNVVKEIIYPKGAKIYLNKITKGDPTMNSLELLISEYQESNTILTDKKRLEILKNICKRENVCCDKIGKINDSGIIEIYKKKKKIISKSNKVISLPLKSILGDNYQKIFQIKEVNYPKFQININEENIRNLVTSVLKIPSVCSKRFLTNKVDRSVTGLIAQQQCIGYLHTPLSNFGIIAQSHYGLTGCVTSIGERPLIGLIDSRKMARMAIGEMLTNMVFAKITCIKDIRCSGNWMWPNTVEGEKYELYKACKEMCKITNEFGFAFDGGKDSLSMVYKDDNTKKIIKCPRQLVISGYAPTNNITCKITPDFKQHLNELIYIDLAEGNKRLGGSVLAQSLNQIGKECPNLENVKLLTDVFNIIQDLLVENKIKSGHDCSDGGLITTLLEMSFSSSFGIDINIDKLLKSNENNNIYSVLFAEELGLVIEVESKYTKEIITRLNKINNKLVGYYIGKIIDNDKVVIKNGKEIVLTDKIKNLRNDWEYTNFKLELKQCNKKCVMEERKLLNYTKKINYKVNFRLKKALENCIINKTIKKYNVAIIREEGSNGDREMASAFEMAGFNVYDICMNDLESENYDLEKFSGIVFVGGFSYSDVLGAANGWYHVIKNNVKINNMLTKFYKRIDTFSLGICNGCQLMSKLGWIPGCKLSKNLSDRFESRFSFVKINATNNIFLKNFESCELGIWIAHGEGRFILNNYEDTKDYIPIQYIDDNCEVTTKYPFNPNGSEYGVAAISSRNGRHLALMPHPERSFLQWQLPYKTSEITNFDNKFTPWFMIFRNAYNWLNNI